MKVWKFKKQCVQYSICVLSMSKLWPHSDITSCCIRSLHAFTFRYNSTLLDHMHDVILSTYVASYVVKLWVKINIDHNSLEKECQQEND